MIEQAWPASSSDNVLIRVPRVAFARSLQVHVRA